MGINVKWEDEEGKQMGFVEDAQNTFSQFLNSSNLKTTELLKYIDQYGDTTFNQLQIKHFIEELKLKINECKSEKDKVKLTEILSLSNKSLGQVHTYLKFYGD